MSDSVTEKGDHRETPDVPPAVDFATVFDHELDYVWKTLARLGVREAELPDVTQDVFVTVMHLLADYDPSRPLRPWLFGIAYRIGLRHRALARHRREVAPTEWDPPDERRGPDEEVDVRRAQALAARALDRIEVHRRAVFVMSEIDGFTMPEIAEALQIPVNTAYSRLRLAREDFRRAVVQVKGEARR